MENRNIILVIMVDLTELILGANYAVKKQRIISNSPALLWA